MGGDHVRLCGGAQVSYAVLGAELGLARDFAGQETAATTALHFAPFVSVEVMTLSMRLGLPLAFLSDDRADHGFQFGLALALKVRVRVNR